MNSPLQPPDAVRKIVRPTEPETHILVAEDHQPTRETLAFLLERKAYRVTAVDNVADALAALNDPHGPTVALLDWNLPDGTGLDICRAVRTTEFPRYVYCLIVTARDGDEDVALALAAGADDFIRKPCGPVELFARVHNGQRLLALQQNLANRIVELEHAMENVRQLQRLLPICMYCKKVRGDSDYWQEIETYIHAQTGADFSHGICPECMHNLEEGRPIGPESRIRET